MIDDLMDEGEMHAETIRLALAGDAEAGRYALLLCRDQLAARSLRPVLADYLAARINDVLDGVKPDRALCIARGRGKPADPLPEWQQELGAMAALLSQRGYKPKQVVIAMCDARSRLHDKPLEDSDAYRIRKTWRPMQSLDPERLRRLAGAYWGILSEYPPLK
ncbi:MAG: hypothetical protein Q8K21_12970 [Hydrogenophaga sp.]|uniref:hypothetical protein n=1 Tax=Hydrogenophaga sp. TaxID=1904254 RepID=UPI00272F501F|nr:hypothetical protein [Hydrogenophaga sp.]MDP2165104.1 hypothetical protein [Hydrogenophaga sp.]MDP3476844.1 hypothetical protein [Hydrogenophaga sp.]